MASETFDPATPAQAPAQAATRRMVDAPTRMLHGLMALGFVGAYLTADGERWRLVHVSLGYTLAGLVGTRLLWGLWGPRQVRLSALWRRLQGLPAWCRSLAAVRTPTALQATWRPGQSLLMALAIALILALVVPLTLSGYAVWDEWGGEWLEDVHAFFGNALLCVALAHVGLIILLSVLRRKNLARPMLTGRIPGTGSDVAKKNHGVLATVVLAGTLAFWAWQWHAAPQAPSQGAVQPSENRPNDDD